MTGIFLCTLREKGMIRLERSGLLNYLLINFFKIKGSFFGSLFLVTDITVYLTRGHKRGIL